jgi:flavin-binding protein dodecin
MKRSRKVVSIKARSGGMTGRDGAIDYAARTALMSREAVNPDQHIYRVIELVGTSEESIEDAITSGIARASSTLRNVRPHHRWDRAALSGDDEGRLHHGGCGLMSGRTHIGL